MEKRTVLPLLNSAFEPGKALETVEQFEDKDVRNIARAEFFYFSGKARECSEIARLYLEDETMELRLSACMLYGYANMTLGNSAAARRGLDGIRDCMKKLRYTDASEETYAFCILAGYIGTVLLHQPADEIPDLWKYSSMLPGGVKLFAVYVMAHQAYPKGEYWSAYGMCRTAMFMAENVYPISMIYIQCIMAMCMINRRHKKEAQEELMKGWVLAEKDGFLEPFIEHHGVLRGLIEVCIRKTDADVYKRIIEGVMSFSRGWMEIHNTKAKRKVTNELSAMEFSIAMMASDGWTNKEIASYMEISVNTVKHYLTDIFSKLNVKKREELKKYMLS